MAVGDDGNEILCKDPNIGYWERWDGVEYSDFSSAHAEVIKHADDNPTYEWKILSVSREVVWRRL